MGLINPILSIRNMKTKICTKCGIEKKLSEFYNNKKGKLGKQAHCKLCDNLTSKKYYILNTNQIKQKTKEYREANLEYYKDYNKEYRENPKNKSKRNKQQKFRYDTDINFKITITLRNRIWDVLNRKPKNKKTLELLGCSIEQLKIHLKSQFKPGMT
jgi:hypothetical protein